MKALSQACVKLPRHGVREIMVRSAKISNAIHLEGGESNVDTPLHIREPAVEAILINSPGTQRELCSMMARSRKSWPLPHGL